MVNLAKAAEKSPAVGRAFEASMEQSIQQAVASYNKVPQVRSGISAAGLTTRDFVLRGSRMAARHRDLLS